MTHARFSGYEHLRNDGSETCNQWLVGFNAHGEMVTLDGCHSTEAGVADALYLILGMGFRSNDDVEIWQRLVFTETGEEFHDVEPDGTDANEEAISINREALRVYYRRTNND